MRGEKIDTRLYERHGFLTFWLCSGLILGLIRFIKVLISLFSLVSYESSEIVPILVPLMYFVIRVVSFILLFKWKIFGFYLQCILAVIYAILLAIYVNTFTITDFLIITDPVLLFTFLHLKKNGLSAWDYLRGTYPKYYIRTADEDEPVQDAFRCNSCQGTFSPGYVTCPRCNSSDIEAIKKPVPVEIPELKMPPSEVTKKCKRCGEKVSEDIFVCPKCKWEAFS